MAERTPIYEEAISLINEPIELPLTAREIVKRRWQVEPRVIEGRKEPENVD